MTLRLIQVLLEILNRSLEIVARTEEGDELISKILAWFGCYYLFDVDALRFKERIYKRSGH